MTWTVLVSKENIYTYIIKRTSIPFLNKAKEIFAYDYIQLQNNYVTRHSHTKAGNRLGFDQVDSFLLVKTDNRTFTHTWE